MLMRSLIPCRLDHPTVYFMTRAPLLYMAMYFLCGMLTVSVTGFIFPETPVRTNN